MPSITGTWESQVGAWGEANAALSQKYPVFTVATAFYRGESGANLASGDPVNVILERTGLAVVSRDSRGEIKSDPSVIKKITGIWPIIVGTPGNVVKVSLGSHEAPSGAITWQGPRNFVIGTDKFLDFCEVIGPYIAIRFESSGMRTWRLLAYDLDIESVGEH